MGRYKAKFHEKNKTTKKALFKSVKVLDLSRRGPVVNEKAARPVLDVKKYFVDLKEDDPTLPASLRNQNEWPHKFYKARIDLVDTIKRAKRINRVLRQFGPKLRTDELQQHLDKTTQSVFYYLDEALKQATVVLDRPFLPKPSQQ